MAMQEQFKPSAPIVFEAHSIDHDHEALSMQSQLNRRRCIRCCGCTTAVFLILAVVILVLNFTVFHIRDPVIKLNSITIQSLKISTKGILSTDVNVTLLVDVSVKNPNAATFGFDNGTTMVYYGGKVVGESVHFRGKAKARRTIRRNVTVEIDPEEFLTVPRFLSDITSSNGLNISSYTRISGRVKIMNMVEKNVMVKFNCSMSFRLSGSDGDHLHEEACKPELDF